MAKRATPMISPSSEVTKNDRGSVWTGGTDAKNVDVPTVPGSMSGLPNNPANESKMDPPRRYNVAPN